MHVFTGQNNTGSNCFKSNYLSTVENMKYGKLKEKFEPNI